MGASLVYLERPNKEIEFEEGENTHMRYTAASMQGWRINMVRARASDGALGEGAPSTEGALPVPAAAVEGRAQID